MRDALAHGIEIHGPKLEHSRTSWTSVPGMGLVAGWSQVKGIGEVMANKIDMGRNSFSDWEDLQAIPGVGPKKVQTIREFATAHDPFGLYRTERTLKKVREYLATQRRIPRPTHDGLQIAQVDIPKNGKNGFNAGDPIVYAGIVLNINMQDIIENRHSRTGQDAEEILKSLKRPDLLNFCSLRCFDDTEEEVYVRINRYKFPGLKRTVESIAVNHDVVIVTGRPIDGFGTPVMADGLYVIDPDS
jgi:hypothetical protein